MFTPTTFYHKITTLGLLGVLTLSLLAISVPSAQAAPPVSVTQSTQPTSSLADDVLYVGHSLVGTVMPAYLQGAVRSQSGIGAIEYQIINGAPLRVNWNDSNTAQGVDSRTRLPGGEYEAVVITEAIPLLNHTTWNDTNGYATKFYNLALSAKPNTRVYLYETWHCILSGTPTGCAYDDNDTASWRSRLTADLPKWEAIVDSVNAQSAGKPKMLVVPAGQAFARLYDEIGAGRVPGISNINQLFTDDIHPNDLGSYFVAMVQYATVYGRTPVGLPVQMKNSYGANMTAPSLALATKFQTVAWDTVRTYARSGVSGGGSTPTATPTPVPTPVPTPTPTPTPVPATNTWTYCAAENAWCEFSGTKTVRYGAGTTFFTKVATGGVMCNNPTFGDPASGVVKKCEVSQGVISSPVVGTSPVTTVAPTLSLSVTPATLTTGSSATLTWNSTNVTACMASGAWTGTKTLSGTQSTGALQSTKTYTLTCTGGSGTVTKTASIGVTSNPLPSTPTPNTPPAATSEFKIGDRIQVTKNVNVRTKGLLSTATLIGVNPQGSVGTIIAGPTATDDKYGKIVWFKVNFDSGFDGWVGADNYAKVTTSDPTPTTPGTQNAVTTTDNLKVRENPAGTVIGVQPVNAKGSADLSKKVTQNGTTWLYVDFASGPDGYVSTTYLNGLGVNDNNQALIQSLIAQLAVLQAALAALLAQ